MIWPMAFLFWLGMSVMVLESLHCTVSGRTDLPIIVVSLLRPHLLCFFVIDFREIFSEYICCILPVFISSVYICFDASFQHLH